MGSMTIDEKTARPNHAGGGSTRRRMLAGSLVGIGGMATASAKPAAILMAKAIYQEESFKCGARRIYEALLDAAQFHAFSGGRAAEIQREAGGAFSLFAGHIVGRNVELVADLRIVQAWRAASWPDGIYSIVRFELSEQGGETRVVLDHTGFPPEKAEDLASGWDENYWTALRKFLG